QQAAPCRDRKSVQRSVGGAAPRWSGRPGAERRWGADAAVRAGSDEELPAERQTEVPGAGNYDVHDGVRHASTMRRHITLCAWRDSNPQPSDPKSLEA